MQLPRGSEIPFVEEAGDSSNLDLHRINAVDLIPSAEWGSALQKVARRTNLSDEWFIRCFHHGSEKLRRCVEIDPHVRGGLPVIRGTRFSVADVFGELAESSAVGEIAENFDLDEDALRNMLNGFALLFNRPFY